MPDEADIPEEQTQAEEPTKSEENLAETPGSRRNSDKKLPKSSVKPKTGAGKKLGSLNNLTKRSLNNLRASKDQLNTAGRQSTALRSKPPSLTNLGSQAADLDGIASVRYENTYKTKPDKK